jgi:hypothetical protein
MEHKNRPQRGRTEDTSLKSDGRYIGTMTKIKLFAPLTLNRVK